MSLTTVEAHLRAALAACDLKGTRLLVARFLWRVLYAADPRPALHRVAECAAHAARATADMLAEFAKYRSLVAYLPASAVPAAAMARINEWAAAHGWGAVPQDIRVYHGALGAAETPVDEPAH